jgi:hypothetical protein
MGSAVFTSAGGGKDLEGVGFPVSEAVARPFAFFRRAVPDRYRFEQPLVDAALPLVAGKRRHVVAVGGFRCTSGN